MQSDHRQPERTDRGAGAPGEAGPAEREEGIRSPREHWEERYRDAPVWSGSVNAAMAAVVESLEADGADGTGGSGPVAPGRALDLGCGEGADAIWLAARGWRVTGTDISATAVSRAAEAARTAGLDDRVLFVAQDLEPWAAGEGAEGGPLTGPFDLVTASFLHSRAPLGRTAILRQAARSLAPGGHLLVVSHAAPPPWSRHAQHDGMELLAPAEEIAALGLPAEQWRTVLAETRTRSAQGPDGQEAELEDGIVLLRRA